jgi:hypothetical protein
MRLKLVIEMASASADGAEAEHHGPDRRRNPLAASAPGLGRVKTV